MKVTKAAWVTNPTTKPPLEKGSWVALLVDGKEKWFDLAADAADGVTDADFDFAKGKKWAAEQKKAAKQAE